MQRTVRKFCRKCHDALERIIRKWECAISRMWEHHPEFYPRIVDAFIYADDDQDLDPQSEHNPIGEFLRPREIRTAF